EVMRAHRGPAREGWSPGAPCGLCHVSYPRRAAGTCCSIRSSSGSLPNETLRGAMTRPAIVTVDDDQQVSAALARDLRRRYGRDYPLAPGHSREQDSVGL